MSREFVLTDVDEGVYREAFTVGPGRLDLGTDDTWKVTKSRMHGGVSDGVDLVEIDNGRLSLSVLPTRGMGIWRGSLGGIPVGWNSPVERPVNPAFVDASRRGGIGWIDGFNELLCRCGLAWHGAPGDDGGEFLTLHGRIANVPAHRVSLTIDTDAGEIRLSGVVDERCLFGTNLRLESELSTRPGSNRVAIADTVTNLGATPAELELLYHVNLGPPFLEPGSTFHGPMADVAPRDERAAEGFDDWTVYGEPEPGFAEQVYFGSLRELEPDWSRVLLRNVAGDRGFVLEANVRELPHFALWKQMGAHEDGYVTGLEPCTSFPNPRAVEREAGRVVVLEPGESRSFHLAFSVLDTAAEVGEIEAGIAP